MARSISHDLRHYLSAVYANAEFLAYPDAQKTGPAERAELLAEVKFGVQGMTELIESLLLFSRAGQPAQLTYESLPAQVEQAAQRLRGHPDAQSVAVELDRTHPVHCWMDAKKVQRAVYNLLLNACHAARFGASSPTVKVLFGEDADAVTVRVEDNGAGVPESVKVTMFQPFVSEGKHGGTGLGLTLAHRIAEEHGGGVTLERSQPGQTVFRMSIARDGRQARNATEMD